MKKYFRHILLLLTFLPSVINAQWYAQYISSGNFINDIRFINRYTGWACGDQIILKTTNGGTNWFNQNAHGYLNQIHPVNDSVAYVCGEYIIMKTTNGGDNWFSLKEGSSQVPIIYGLWFNNENTGWFCGDRVAMRTTDGGQTFIDSMFIDGVLNDIHFKNDSIGNIAAWGRMYRTINSGINWYPVPLPSYSITPFTQRVTFVGDTGWTTTTGGYIYRTTNYGINWDSLTLIQLGGLCIEFADKLHGYAGGNNGLIYKTTDGGYNWSISLSTGIGPFTSIYALDDSIVWAVGGPGSRYIMNTINGGITNMISQNVGSDVNYHLNQNYPNPFNSTSVISFKVKSNSFVTLRIYDIAGKEIGVLFNENLSTGLYRKIFDGSNLNSGVYFYKLSLFDFDYNKYYSETKKFLIIK
jgi:photosystem II stability/assembly factor-like uncharacterized protein